MTGKDIETDPQPKWLRPIDPLVAAGLLIRIDPRLGVDDDTAYRLQCDADPLVTTVTVFVTSNYDNVLAAEVTDDAEHGPHVLVRAATGDEAAYLLSPDDEQDGDCPESAGREITWQRAEDSEDVTERAVVLWSGEVLLKSGKGLAGPFYTHQSAAAAWAFSTALGMPRAEVFGAQLVRWLCAKSKAGLLLAGGVASSGGSIAFGWRRSAPPPSSKLPSPVRPGRGSERFRDRVETESADRRLRFRRAIAARGL